jgi:serine/threonine-protein kinase RsbW
VRPTPAAQGLRPAGREFSPETMTELLRALRARAAEHPESPGLIASWPGVPAARMPAACAELRRLGHAVREVAVAHPRDKVRRGWVVDGPSVDAAPSPRLGEEFTVLLREPAEPKAVPMARAALEQVAEREGVPEAVRSAVMLAVTEACANVVVHAYADADAPGDVVVGACTRNAVLMVEVQDDGRGLLPRIDGPGLGLGLPLIAQMTDVLEIRTSRKRRGLVLRMHFNLDDTTGTN